MDIYNEIPIIQNKCQYDPDSSPQAYEFYRNIYQCTLGSKFDLINIHPMVRCDEDKKYHNVIQTNAYNRLEALEKGVLSVGVHSDGCAVYNACNRVSGETDFNFKFDDNPYKDKAGKLISIAKDDEAIKDRLINHYSQRHHALVNFSLMFVPGNLQGIKSKGIADEWLDRVDSFIYLLAKYYRGNNSRIIPAGPNGTVLKNYLDMFKHIENYCRIIYLIDDTQLVEEMIESGKKPLQDKSDVERYLELADRFWNEKSKNMELVKGGKIEGLSIL